MMRNKIFLMLGIIAVAALCSADTRAQTVVPKNQNILYTDLITDGVGYKTLDDKQVKVAVRNLGTRDAGNSVLKFALTKDGKTITRHAVVAQVKAKSVVWVPISLGDNLYLSQYCVTADSSDRIKETKEDNNTRCGEFGGKP